MSHVGHDYPRPMLYYQPCPDSRQGSISLARVIGSGVGMDPSWCILRPGLPRRATVFSVERAANEVDELAGGVPKRSLKKPAQRGKQRQKEGRDWVPQPLSELWIERCLKPMYPSTLPLYKPIRSQFYLTLFELGVLSSTTKFFLIENFLIAILFSGYFDHWMSICWEIIRYLVQNYMLKGRLSSLRQCPRLPGTYSLTGRDMPTLPTPTPSKVG